MLRSVLIANRGEIAVRIVRTAKRLGLRTVAIYSDADEGAPWTRLADAAAHVGAAPARASYLDIDRIVAAALDHGVECVHPGYGLLSENAGLVRAVEAAGLLFVGPRPETLDATGDKTAARAAAVRAGLPVLPGSLGNLADPDAARQAAEAIGFPLMVKASFGGGGRGLRVARHAAELETAMTQAGREAQAAFGRSDVYLEALLERPRHVEVQILGDRHGGLVHLGDRDCTVQRRHQKMLEEAPAPGLSDDLRQRMADAALNLGRALGYEGVGTVEFLVAGEAFYFLELNPRLQVEHGVTEMVTGLDLVEWQFRVAAGERLVFTQTEVRQDGHAIQARIAAEDPAKDFRPAPGRIETLGLPGGPGVRCDFGIRTGDEVPPFYDSMVGKVMAWGADRDMARRRLAGALAELEVGGVSTTAAYLLRLLDEPAFAAVTHDTGSIERDWAPDVDDAVVGPEPTSPAHRTVRVAWGAGMSEIAIHARGGPGSGRKPVNSRSRIAGAIGDGAPRDAAIRAPMDAVIVQVVVQNGARVVAGDVVLILEAMKMELVLRAARDGVIGELEVATGQAVRVGERLFTVRDAPLSP